MCRLLVGLPDVAVRGVEARDDEVLEIVVELDVPRPTCDSCGKPVTIKQTVRRRLVDLPCFGRRTRTIWLRRRWHCRACATPSWTQQAPTIVADRHVLTDRAARWATFQVGRHGRAVSAVADDLGCDWHTVNDAVMAYGQVLVDDPDRIARGDAPRDGRGLPGACWALPDQAVVLAEGPGHGE